MSVAAVRLRGEPTGVAMGWNADVVATAKRDLAPGEMLDGEGGYTVWGKVAAGRHPAAMGGLPLGLAHNVKLLRAVKKGQSLSWDDVAMDTKAPMPTCTRRAMEAMFAPRLLDRDKRRSPGRASAPDTHRQAGRQGPAASACI